MWSAVLGWVVQGIIIAALVGAAFGVLSMTPPQYSLAQIFFTIASVLLRARVGWCSLPEKDKTAQVSTSRAAPRYLWL
jgi:hypothetical protein